MDDLEEELRFKYDFQFFIFMLLFLFVGFTMGIFWDNEDPFLAHLDCYEVWTDYQSMYDVVGDQADTYATWEFLDKADLKIQEFYYCLKIMPEHYKQKSGGDVDES